MTFEEVYEVLYKKYKIVSFDYSDNTIKAKDYITIDTCYLLDLINGLKETYAPKIKMTKVQFDWFEEAREKYKNLEGVYIALYFRDEKSRGISFEMLMQAWLHPELIEVKDD